MLLADEKPSRVTLDQKATLSEKRQQSMTKLNEKNGPSEGSDTCSIGQRIFLEGTLYEIDGFYDSSTKRANAKRKGKWLPLPLEEVRAEAVWAGHLKISITSVNTSSRKSYSIKFGAGKYSRSHVMLLSPGSNDSLSQQMLMNMLLAMEKPDELSKRAIDNFGSALRWMLKNIRTYNELRALQLPRLLVRLRNRSRYPRT